MYVLNINTIPLSMKCLRKSAFAQGHIQTNSLNLTSIDVAFQKKKNTTNDWFQLNTTNGIKSVQISSENKTCFI